MKSTSKLTAQAQVSVPAAIRRKLGLAPGSQLSWETEGDRVIVRRLGTHTCADVHRALFEAPVPRKTLKQLKDGIRKRMRKQHAGD